MVIFSTSSSSVFRKFAWIISLGSISLALNSLPAAMAADFTTTCPASGVNLSSVEVLDGPREDNAFLMGEDRGDEGRFNLAYIYDAGRFVSVRCLYSDGKAVDLTIRNRISECRYKIRNGVVSNFECR